MMDETTGIAAALNHLAQSVARGVMDADSLRWVMEFLPAVFAAIQDESGVSRRDLIDLARGPGIPSKVILGALMAVKHQAPKDAPDLTVACAQFGHAVAEMAREDAGRARSFLRMIWG